MKSIKHYIEELNLFLDYVENNYDAIRDKGAIKKYEVISRAIADLDKNSISVPEVLIEEKNQLEKDFNDSKELIDTFEYFKTEIANLNRRVSKLKTTERKDISSGPRKSPRPSAEILGFSLNNTDYETNSWVGMFGLINEIIYFNNKYDFDRVLELRGKKKPYYSLYPGELRSPKQIAGTNIYFEANLSAAYITKMISKLLDLFGYSDEDFEIHYR